MNGRKVMNGRRIRMRFIFRFTPNPSAFSNFFDHVEYWLNAWFWSCSIIFKQDFTKWTSMFDCTQTQLLRIKNIWLHSKLFEEGFELVDGLGIKLKNSSSPTNIVFMYLLQYLGTNEKLILSKICFVGKKCNLHTNRLLLSRF